MILSPGLAARERDEAPIRGLVVILSSSSGVENAPEGATYPPSGLSCQNVYYRWCGNGAYRYLAFT